MPLKASASSDAFTENLKAELDAGKPRKQALAIAYETQRRAGTGPKRTRQGRSSMKGKR